VAPIIFLQRQDLKILKTMIPCDTHLQIGSLLGAIVLWNTVYLGRAIHALREQGRSVDEKLLTHLSPLGWEHINLTGDYVWHANKRVAKGRFRPLRTLNDSMTRLFTPQAEA
jgi:hypothetical protein